MRTWIFQANPNKYQIHESLQLEKKEYWNLRQHAKEVKIGDRVLIWICGQDAGIYATGRVLTDPSIQPDSATGLSYWITKRDGRQPMARVLVEYDRVLLDDPLRKAFLQCDPALWNLKILAAPRRTNFAVSEEEWQAINTWLGLK